MKKVRVRVIQGWEDGETRFNFGDEMEVYDLGTGEFFWDTRWGQYFLPCECCEVIEKIWGEL